MEKQREMIEQLIRLEIKMEKQALALLPEVMEVTRQFSGKVFTKRFSDAVRNIDPWISAATSVPCENYPEITYRYPEACVEIENRCEYLAYRKEYLFKGKRRAQDGHGFTDGEDRICADYMLEQMASIQTHIEKKIREKEEQVERLDEIILRRKILENQIRKLRDDYADSVNITIFEYLRRSGYAHEI
jgi:hypothetical protein